MPSTNRQRHPAAAPAIFVCSFAIVVTDSHHSLFTSHRNSSPMAYVIGIDGGTESMRAFVFDLEGRPKGIGVVPYLTAFPAPAQAEQNPDDWWQALGEASRRALNAAAVRAAEIDSICVDTTSCSVATFDQDMKPLRPTLIWMDVRAADEAADVAATGDPALRLASASARSTTATGSAPRTSRR